MNTRDTKLSNCYTQGQRSAARILLTVWLLTSYSPDITRAAPEGGRAMVTTTIAPEPSAPGALTLPSASGPAMERVLQQRMSQEAVPYQRRGLRRTSIEVIPVGENLSFQARGGEQVRFHYEADQWRAEVLSRMGGFSRQSVLPVVCILGEDVASSLEILSRYPSWYSQRQIHVLGGKVFPALGEVVYVGELGLKGGGQAQSSASSKPQGELPANPAEQGDYEPSELEVSSRTKGKQLVSEDVAHHTLSDPHLVVPSSARGSASSQLPSSSQIGQGPEAAHVVASVATSSKSKALHSTRLTSNSGVSQAPSSAITAGRQIPTALAIQEAKTFLRLVNRLGALGAHFQGHKLAELFLKLRQGLLELKIFKRSEGDAPLAEKLRALVRDLQVAKTSEKLIDLGEVLLSLAESKQKEGDSSKDLSHYTDAAILYQHILSICAKEQDTLASEETTELKNSAYQGLAQLQASMLAQAKGAKARAEAITQTDIATLQKCISEDRGELEAFRAD
ncbi:MAG: hypothetical protein AAF400_03035, partial [Bacteroidota bacterium]